jgi:hypothetical protein
VWMSPIAGAVAPALYLVARSALSDNVGNLPGAFAVWAFRDLIIGYCATLPVLAIFWRIGTRNPALFWMAATLMGGPMGYVLANPVEFAWSPTEMDFQHGPYWSVMLAYMALFGLSGLAFSYFGRQEERRLAQ